LLAAIRLSVCGDERMSTLSDTSKENGAALKRTLTVDY
jgi:hypothetical protein